MPRNARDVYVCHMSGAMSFMCMVQQGSAERKEKRMPVNLCCSASCKLGHNACAE